MKHIDDPFSCRIAAHARHAAALNDRLIKRHSELREVNASLQINANLLDQHFTRCDTLSNSATDQARNRFLLSRSMTLRQWAQHLLAEIAEIEDAHAINLAAIDHCVAIDRADSQARCHPCPMPYPGTAAKACRDAEAPWQLQRASTWSGAAANRFLLHGRP